MVRCLSSIVVFAMLLLLQKATVTAADQVVVVLDDSGSMERGMRTTGGAKRRMDVAIESLVSVLSKLPPETRVGILALNSTTQGSNWIVPVAPLGESEWQARLMQVRARGGTPLGRAVQTAADELLASRAKDPGGFFRLLVVTDGEANDRDLLDSLLPDLLSRGIRLDAIGVDMAQNHSLAERSHSYRNAADRSTLEQALTEVFAETSADDVASQADFDMLAGLPDDVAGELVKAMAVPRNQPIAPLNEFAVPAGAVTPVAVPNPISPNQNRPAAASGFVSFLGTVCCLGGMGAIFFLIVLAASAAKAASQKPGG